MMNQLMYINHIDSLDDEHVQRGGSQQSRKPNKDRFACFTHNCSTTIISHKYMFLMLPPFARSIGCVKVFCCDGTIMFVQMTTTLSKKTNCACVIGLSSLHKTTAAMHMLSFGTLAKAQEEYCRMTPSSIRESMLR